MSFYEHLCSNPQFISLPEEVREFLLHFVKNEYRILAVAF